MAEKKQVPAVEGLFTWPSDEPHLIGAKCKGCGTYFFPKFSQFHKPGCEGGPVEEVLLSRRGRVVSYTKQYYGAPWPFIAPEPFSPYAVVLVALPEGIEVPGQLTGMEMDQVRTNMDVELLVEKLYEDEENEFLTWKFRPA